MTRQGRVWMLSFDFCVHARCPNTRLVLMTSPLAPIRQVTLLTITGVHVGRLTKPNRRAQCFIRVLVDACVNVFTLLTAITSPVVMPITSVL